jgi:hypothetical protein
MPNLQELELDKHVDTAGTAGQQKARPDFDDTAGKMTPG